MSTVTVKIKDRSLKRKLSQIAKDRFGGDEMKAASQILEKALRTERVVDKKKLEELMKHPAFGIWKDRKRFLERR